MLEQSELGVKIKLAAKARGAKNAEAQWVKVFMFLGLVRSKLDAGGEGGEANLTNMINNKRGAGGRERRDDRASLHVLSLKLECLTKYPKPMIRSLDDGYEPSVTVGGGIWHRGIQTL